MTILIRSRNRFRAVTSVVAIAGTVAALCLTAPAAEAATTTLAPTALTNVTGSNGGQGFAVLGVQDQAGTTDTWAKYVEFGGQLASANYSGYATYALPGTTTAASITGLQVNANYRGPASAGQLWTFSLYNYATSAWVSVGTNATAPAWGSWKLLTFAASGTIANYVSSAGALRVQLTSNNASDNTDIDYLAIAVTSGTSADTTAPTTPTGVTVGTKTATSVALSWTASSDNIGVAGYEVFAGTSTTPVATTTGTGTTTTVTGLAAATTYSLTVKARDAAGNRSAASTAISATTSAAVGYTLPPANGVFDYQLGGAYTPTSSVAIVDRDRTDPAAAGKYNICYINAFQSQRGDSGTWPSDVFLRTPSGGFVEDAGWPGEYIFDTSTPALRNKIMLTLGAWMQDCANRGFAAIEPDNLDTWTRSGSNTTAAGGVLTQAENVELAKLLVIKAHSLGLAIAQKNTAELLSIGKSQIGFDFAVVEECQFFNECNSFTNIYGNQIYEVEYSNRGIASFDTACSARGATVSVTYRDKNVVPLGTSGYVFQNC